MGKVRLNLAGLDGNGYNLLGEFRLAAKEQGWSARELKAACDEAAAGDYDHLLRTLEKYTEPTDADAAR